MSIIEVNVSYVGDSKEQNVDYHPIVRTCEEVLVEAARGRVELVVFAEPEVWWFRGGGWKLARTLERATYDQLLRRLCVVMNGNPPKEHTSMWNSIALAPANEDAVYCFAAEVLAVSQGVLRALIEVVPSLAALRERADSNQLAPRAPPGLSIPGWSSHAPYR